MAESASLHDPAAVAPLCCYTSEEQEILQVVIRSNGEAWTLRHAYRILAEARAIGELPAAPPERPIFTVGRVSENGRMSLDAMLALARLSLGRDLTPDEIAETQGYWFERFPEPAHEEPTAE